MNQYYDVVIVGAGASGLYAALQFDKKYKVLVLSKRELTLSNSSLAQGGVAAVLDKEHDNKKLHMKDTLIAGKYENNPAAIEVLVNEGPMDVVHLKELGVDFDTSVDGKMEMTLEAGHSRSRIVHHKDSTGKAIVDALLEQAKNQDNITILENAMTYKLDNNDGLFTVCVMYGNKYLCFYTRFCILATGGIGRVYEYTTNSAVATGDGITLAYNIGAKVKNLSRIQFHPTAFSGDRGRERFLISEAVRGEGAVLLNCNGESFSKKYDERGDLAPRDVLSNAIMKESIRTGSTKFYLDITKKDPEFIKNRFPMIYERCLEEGIDITKDRIPVFPCQHYLMGGIDVDLNSRTTIQGLYAVGECSHTGVHGANRLASNSLLEAVVFSRRAAEDISNNLKNADIPPNTFPAFKSPIDSGRQIPKGIRTEIRRIMQDTNFIVKKPKAVPEGLKRVTEILDNLYTEGYSVTADYVEALSLATVAYIILNELNNSPKEKKEERDTATC